MKRTLLTGLVLALAVWLGAQTSNSAAGPSSSQSQAQSQSADPAPAQTPDQAKPSSSDPAQGPTGQTSDQTAKPSKKGKKSAGMKQSTLTGCLSGPNDQGAYTLTNRKHKTGVEVSGPDELKSHAGHRVKLTGEWASGEKTHFNASKITHISETCGGGKKGKAAKTSM